MHIKKQSVEANADLSRRKLLKTALAGGVVAATFPSLAKGRVPKLFASDIQPSELDEISVVELQDGMKAGKYTARSIAEAYIKRIDEIDKKGPAINSIIELNPDALKIADGLDRERKEKGPRGPMHGIPVVIKDNIATADGMMTTAGSLALVGAKPLEDSFVVRKLREAGAIILGKTNLSE